MRDENVQTDKVTKVSVTCSTEEPSPPKEKSTASAPKAIDVASQVSINVGYKWYETHVHGVLDNISNAVPDFSVHPQNTVLNADTTSPGLSSNLHVETSTAVNERLCKYCKNNKSERTLDLDRGEEDQNVNRKNTAADSLKALHSLISQITTEKHNIARKKVNMPTIPLGILNKDVQQQSEGYVLSNEPKLPSLLRDLINTVEKEKQRISSLRF